MPEFKDTIRLTATDNNKALATAYQTFKTLGWDVQYAGENQIIGSTPRSWKRTSQQILVEYALDELTIQSKMVQGESFDLKGMNKKNVAAFIGAYQNLLQNITDENVQSNISALEQFRQDTAIAVEQEKKEAELVDKAMNISGSNLYFTYGLIAVNVLVFILMAFDGAGIIDANGLVHIKWGSNFSPLTLTGDYWRLITCNFIHFGIIHLVMNMYCLYSIGIYLEPMLGNRKYITAYLATGILSAITSLWWHTEPVNSAGASGAVFGLYGLFLALLTTDLIPKSVRKALLQSIGIFIVYNLVYGMKSGVDNSAHVGGLLSGFVIGYLYVIAIRAQKQEKETKWVLPLVIIATLGISFTFVEQHKGSATEREKIASELKQSSYKDNEKFNDNYNNFIEIQDNVLAVYSDTTLDTKGMRTKLTEFSIPEWNKAESLMQKSKSMDISPEKQKKADVVLEYIDLRKQEVAAAIKVLDNGENASDSLNVIREKINIVVEGLR